MKFTASLIASAGMAAAFPAYFEPQAVEQAAARLARRQDLLHDPLGVSRAQGNCGPSPCLTFDAKSQYVSTTGENAYVSPAAGDIRGPCPGLNAAANHGYLPRNGIASIEQTVAGLGAAYGMSPELAVALAAYAIAIDGNIAEGVWSIGGPLPTDPLGGKLLGTGQGLSYSHNNYEGDASIGRDDAYVNNGDAHSLNISKFTDVYNLRGSEDRYTLDKFRQRFQEVQQRSIATNPYYFTGAFSTIVVVPAAYNFVINFMSNHSSEEPEGYLDGSTFKQFFGVAGDDDNLQWIRGQERIPDNWYKRAVNAPYTLNDVFEDVAITYLAYPNTLLIGGNTGKTNSFLGLDISNLTGNAYALETLFEGDNFGCFATVVLQQAIPDFLNKAIGALAPATDLINKSFAPYTGNLSCPEIGQYDQTIFNQFPGYSYSPTGPDTNY